MKHIISIQALTRPHTRRLDESPPTASRSASFRSWRASSPRRTPTSTPITESGGPTRSSPATADGAKVKAGSVDGEQHRVGRAATASAQRRPRSAAATTGSRRRSVRIAAAMRSAPVQPSALPAKRGKLAVMARAINKVGQTQTAELILNPAGYHHNVDAQRDARRDVRRAPCAELTLPSLTARSSPCPAFADEEPRSSSRRRRGSTRSRPIAPPAIASTMSR